MTKEKLILQWKLIRSDYFNRLEEDMNKFEKIYSSHPLYDSVIKHFDKSFKQINQIANNEIERFLREKN